MEKIIKLTLFWVLRFFDCLFSKRYWSQKIIPVIKNIFLKIFSIYFLIEFIVWVFFIAITIVTLVICLVPGLFLKFLDIFFPNSPLLQTKKPPIEWLNLNSGILN